MTCSELGFPCLVPHVRSRLRGVVVVRVLLWPACRMWCSLCCDRGVLGALCWFTIVLAATGRLVWGPVVAHMGLAGCVGLLKVVPDPARFALGVFGCGVVMLLPALCLAGFVGMLSSSPPNGRRVLLLGVLGRGGCLGFGCSGPAGLGRTGRPPERVLCATRWGSCVQCCCRARPYGRACLACAWPASMVGRALPVLYPPPWSGVLCWCRARRIVRRVCLCVARLHGRACCVGAGPAAMVGCATLVCDPPPWMGVRCCCVTPRRGRAYRVRAGSAAMVGCVVLVWDPTSWSLVRCWCVTSCHGGACFVGAGPAAVVGRGCLRLVRRLSTVGVMPTPSPSPLNVRLSRQRKIGPTFPPPGPLPHAQSFISHRMEPSGLVAVAVPLDRWHVPRRRCQLPSQKNWSDIPCPWPPATCTILHLASHGAFGPCCCRGPA